MWEQIRSNQRRSLGITLGMAVLLALLGAALGVYLLGDPFIGVGIGLVVWGVMAFVAYRKGADIMLRVAGARRIEKKDHPRLWNIVEEMTIAAGLPTMPSVYIIDDPAPNAFATGRDPERAAVAVTTGLISRLDRDELQGVVAHEIGHVKNRDILLMIITGVMLGTIVILADVGVRSWFWGGRLRTRGSSREGGQAQVIMLVVALLVMILTPIMARLMYLAISRKREYLADASAAQFTRYPEGLASALEKISGAQVGSTAVNRVTAPMYIVAPLQRTGKALSNLGSTHPPIERRIKILRAMASGASLGDYERAYRRETGTGVVPPSALKASEPASLRKPSEEEETPATATERAREALDTLWKVGGYLFLTCACGAKLKIPPQLRGSRFGCPHCGRQHEVPARPNGPAAA